MAFIFSMGMFSALHIVMLSKGLKLPKCLMNVLYKHEYTVYICSEYIGKAVLHFVVVLYREEDDEPICDPQPA